MQGSRGSHYRSVVKSYYVYALKYVYARQEARYTRPGSELKN